MANVWKKPVVTTIDIWTPPIDSNLIKRQLLNTLYVMVNKICNNRYFWVSKTLSSLSIVTKAMIAHEIEHISFTRSETVCHHEY